MEKMRKKTKQTPSNLPYLAVGVLWLVLSLLFPMYKGYSYVVMGIICVASYFVMRKVRFFKDTVITYEEEIPYSELSLMEIINEGEGYIKDLSKANDIIDNEKVSTDIDDIVVLAKEILARVKEYPDKVSNIRKFISYYLPTIVKLLNYYSELEKATPSENVKISMDKIEATLDQVEKGFKEQLDSLYEKEAIDISTDITVLETLLQQEQYVINKERN